LDKKPPCSIKEKLTKEARTLWIILSYSRCFMHFYGNDLYYCVQKIC